MAGNRLIKATGRLDVDHNQVRILLSGPTGEVSEDIRRRARAVQRRAQTRAPRDTGLLRSSISVNTRYPSTGADAEITAGAPYAAFVEFGRKTVVPVRKKKLHWMGKYGEVFTDKAASVGATNFMRDSLDAADD